MKIINPGRLGLFTGICKSCRCEVEAKPSDFYDDNTRGEDGDGDSAEIIWGKVMCPTEGCAGKIHVIRIDVQRG